jgi:hypothetical protein
MEKLQEFLIATFARLQSELEQVLDGLTPDDLNYRPGPDSNSIGWLVWHSTRSQDRMNADLFSEDQLWVREKWYVKFNRAPDQKDTGMRHTSEQVAAFRTPDSATLLDYYRAVSVRTREYLNTRLSAADLSRQVWSPTLESSATVEARLIRVVNNFQHIGQASYVRGLNKGKGWYGP